jgi:hypothetical protein
VRLKPFVRLLLGFSICVVAADAYGHCDVAYSAAPTIAYKNTPHAVVDSRTSIFAAENYLSKRSPIDPGSRAGLSFAQMTSAQIRAAMPKDVSDLNTKTIQANEIQKRQKILTYWLLYVRKLYEEQNFSSVVATIRMLRAKGVLIDSAVNDGYDDGDVVIEAFFSIGTLTRIFRAYEEPAKLAVLSTREFDQAYRNALKATIETQASTFHYEDPDLLGYGRLKRKYTPQIGQDALRPAISFAKAQAQEKVWDRIGNLSAFDEILGVSDDVKNQVDMFIKAGSVVGSLAIDKESGTATLYAGLDCRNDFEGHLNLLERALPKGKERFALSALVKAGDRYVLTVNQLGHVYIDEQEFSQLMDGKSVGGKDSSENDGGFNAAISKLIQTKTSLVLWSHPMMQKSGQAREATMKFAHALGRAYPDLNVVIDDPNPRVPLLAEKIAQLPIPAKNIYVVIDRQYSVKFQGALADDADELRKQVGRDNVVFFDGNEPSLPPSADERAVIVITGHSDSALEAFIDRLAEKGYLRNNLVVLQSCGSELSPRLVSKINNKYGAAGTFHYPDKILEDDALQHTKEVLRAATSASTAFGRIVRDRAAKPPKAWGRAMEGVWTICEALAIDPLRRFQWT